MQKSSFEEKVLSIYRKFETSIAVILSIFIAIIILVALVRVGIELVELFREDISQPNKILFEDFQSLFGKILTLLISLEFLSSIVNILKYHDIRKLLEDVVLISGLAIARKLIVYDYDKHKMEDLIGLAILFLSIGVFYFLMRKNRRGELSDD